MSGRFPIAALLLGWNLSVSAQSEQASPLAQPAPPADPWAKVDIRSQPVAGQVHVIWGRGGNIGVFAGADGVFLVDDQFAPLTDRIVEAIQAIHPGPIRFLINTHAHPDHTGGNENFGRRGTHIFAHDRARARLAEGLIDRETGEHRAAAAPGALPVVTFTDRLRFHLNGESVDVYGVPPAHTDGDSFVHFRGSDVMHLGDVLRMSGYPVVDVANGGSFQGIIDALGLALDHSGPDTQFIPGHGAPADRDAVIRLREMLLTIRDRVAARVAADETLEQILAARPTAEFDERWAGTSWFGPEALVRVIHAELTGPEG